MTLERNEKPTIDRICRGLRQDQQLITLFNKNFVPISCRSSLEGVWHFAYQVSQWVECRDAANTFKTMGRTKDNKAETDGRNIKSLSKV